MFAILGTIGLYGFYLFIKMIREMSIEMEDSAVRTYDFMNTEPALDFIAFCRI